VRPFYKYANVVTTSTPPLFTEHYHLSVLDIGLTYLAIGAGTLIGSIGWGKLLDRDWKYVEAKHIEKGYKKPKNPIELIDFPLEYARTRSTWYPLIAFWIFCAAYGWTVQYAVNLAVPLLFQAILGAAMVSIMSSFQALLIDLHPGRSASAAASVCSMFVRC
jgi:MFS family permease